MLHLVNTALLERVDYFFRAITPQDKVCIIHDTDPDGICSAVIVAKGIERLRGRTIELHLPIDKKNYGITKGMLAQLRKKKITKLITCDFSPEQYLKGLRAAAKNRDVLVIDHHKIYADTDKLPALFYKPQLFMEGKAQQYCTAKLAYDSLSRVVDVSDLDWMAVSASIADIATAPWMDWIRLVYRKYDLVLTDNLFETALGEVATIISSVEVYDTLLCGKSFRTMYDAKLYQDVLGAPLVRYKHIIDKEIGKHVQLFERKKETHGELLLYKLTSRYRIHSVLSTILGLDHPHNTIVIINTSKPFISVSARRNDCKLGVNTLLENATKGFQGSNAGGHIPAAGGGFPRKYLNTFKKRVIAVHKRGNI